MNIIPFSDSSFAEDFNSCNMKKNILIFGLILGIILYVNMVYMVNLCYTNPDFKSNEILGYAAMRS